MKFWSKRKVLITGHTGFKGSWLALWLQNMNAEVAGYSLAAPTHPSMFEEARIASSMMSVLGDVRDGVAVQKVFNEFRPEIVIHMAAQPLVRYSYENPVDTYATNVMGTVNVLEAVRRAGCVRVAIIVTSDKCYENREWIWGYREADAMGGFDPYSNSKGCAELVTASFRNSFFHPAKYEQHGVALASVRAGNVIGGGDWAQDRLVPDTIKALSKRHPVSIRNPHATRPWQHVLEPLNGYLKLAQRLSVDGPKFGEAWNFGPNEEDVRSVEWIVQRMVALWGNDASWNLNPDSHPHEANLLKLDSSKARSKLQWQPKFTLEECLCHVVDWYKAHQERQDMREFSLQQIRRYESGAQGLTVIASASTNTL